MSKIKMKMPNTTVAETFESFLNSRRAAGLTEKTLQTYRYQWAAISRRLDVGIDIAELSKQHLDAMIATMRADGLAPNSINSYTRLLTVFLHWCAAEGLTKVSMQQYRGEETVKDTYTNDELKRLLKKPNVRSCSFTEFRNWVIVNLLVNSGCRAATVRNIRISDVNLDSGTIAYRHNKNHKVQATPLCSAMVSVLREYLRIRGGEPQDYLFPNETGGMMTENGFRYAIKHYNESRGVSKTSVHLFRHTFAERYLRNGGNPFNLQRLLGHSTLDMTKHYCRIYDAELVKGYDDFSPLSTLK